MGMNYPSQSAIAAILGQIGQQKKKKALEDTLDKARAKGYDVEIVIDPETGKQATKLHYKSKTQSDLVKDQFDVAKMLADMQKWKRGEEEATQESEYQGRIGNWLGTKPTSLKNSGINKENIKNMLLYRNRNLRPEFQGQEFMKTEKGKYRQVKPFYKEEKGKMSPEYSADLEGAVTAIGKGKDPMAVYRRIAVKYPEKSAELKRILIQQENMTDLMKALLLKGEE